MWFEPTPGEDFEPSVTAKSLWTYTRKSSFNAGRISLPGLFTTRHLEVDATLFGIVICLEAWGLISLVISSGLMDALGSSNWLSIGAVLGVVVALILIDLFLALGRHLPAGANCRYENMRVVDADPRKLNNIQKRRAALKFVSLICTILIIAMAGVKIYLFYKLNEREGITGLTASVLVSYVIAAIIHINNTGYFLFALIFGLVAGRDYNKWKNGDAKSDKVTIYRRRRFPIEVPSNETVNINEEARAGGSFVRKGNANKNETPYVLETYGVLTDRALQDLSGQQPAFISQATVAHACLEAQLEILDNDPVESDKPVTPPRREKTAAASAGTMSSTAPSGTTSVYDQTIRNDDRAN